MTCYFDIYWAFNIQLQLQISKYLTFKVTIKTITFWLQEDLSAYIYIHYFQSFCSTNTTHWLALKIPLSRQQQGNELRKGKEQQHTDLEQLNSYPFH